MSDEWDLSTEGLVDSITDLSMENNRLRQLNAELLAACETWAKGSRCFCYVSLPEKPCFYCQSAALIARAKEATS